MQDWYLKRALRNSPLLYDGWLIPPWCKIIYNGKFFTLFWSPFINESNDKDLLLGICPVCGKRFPKIKGKIYCSEKCRWEAKGYPSIEEVNKIEIYPASEYLLENNDNLENKQHLISIYNKEVSSNDLEFHTFKYNSSLKAASY